MTADQHQPVPSNLRRANRTRPGTAPCHFILNVGLARCGTTATASLVARLSGIGTPVVTKEIKYFLKDRPTRREYLMQFPAGPRTFFESSPPYTHGGPERLRKILDRALSILRKGDRLTVVFLMRNLLERAFSHYWHDIGSQYARFGHTWGVRDDHDPARFVRLYQRSFSDELVGDEAATKFLPDAAKLVTIAIEAVGAEHVRIGHTRSLDACLADLLGPSAFADLAATPRIPSAAAPLLLWTGGGMGPLNVVLRDGTTAAVTVPPDKMILFTRRHAEVLSADRYDLGAIATAAASWSRTLTTADLPEVVRQYGSDQASALAALPDMLFLAGCRDALLADVARLPERLAISALSPTPRDLARLLTAAAASA